jgi:hypothetical protein
MSLLETLFPDKKKPKIVKTFDFKPQTDITAYELSLLMKFFVNKRPYDQLEKEVNDLPDNVKRHIKIISNEQ